MKPIAVIIFIDNSARSIDGDFLPNRLTAQINTVERYAQWLFNENTSSNPNATNMNSGMSNYNGYGLEYENFYENRETRDLFSDDSLVAIGTMGSEEFGIRSSFTSNYNRIEKTLATIKTGGTALLERSIKLGFMALKHAPPSAQLKMIIFINSSELNILESTMDDKKVDELNKKILENKKIAVNFIVIGNDSMINVPNIQSLQNFQNFATGIPQNIPNSNSQNLPILQTNPLFQNMIQNQQYFIQNQSDVAGSKRKTKSKKNSTNVPTSVLQRIIKKARHATIMIIRTCSTVLSDVVMATELGIQLPSGSQIISGAPASGGRKKDNMNIMNSANIRSSNSSINGMVYDPDLDPRVRVGNVKLSVADMQMIENEFKQSQIQSAVALASSAASLSSSSSASSIKKERKSTKANNKIMYQNSNMPDQQLFPLPIQNISLPEQKQTRGRKPKNAPLCISSNSVQPKLDFTLTMPQVIMSYNGDTDSSFDIINFEPLSNDKKTSISTPSSISISSNPQSFSPMILNPIVQGFQPVSLPATTTSNPKTTKGRNANTLDKKDEQIEKDCDNPVPQSQQRQRKQRKTKKIDENG